MQDKNRFEDSWDDAFMDKAWSNMQELLDKELPTTMVHVVRRPWWTQPILWALLATSLVVVLIWWNRTEKEEQSRSTPAPQAELPIASVDQPNWEDPNLLYASTSPTTIVPSLLPSKIPLESRSGPPKPPPLPSTTSAYLSTNSIAYDQKSTLKSSTSTLLTPLAPLNTPYLEVPNGAANTATQQLASFDALPALTVQASSKPSFVPLLKPIQLASKRFQLGAQAGVLLRDETAKGGFNLGLRVNYQLNKRLSIASGLQFVQHQLTNYEKILYRNGASYDGIVQRPEGDFSPDKAEYAELDDYFDLRYTELVTTNFRTLNISYLSLPILMSFNLSQRFKVLTGVEIARLLNATTNDDLRLSVSGLDQAVPALDFKEQHLKVEEGLAKWDMIAMVGVGYYPFRRVGVELSGHFGLNDFTKDQWWGQASIDAHQYWKCNLVYLF